MRGLYRYLSPFTPDQSGAESVLFESGGIIIICDAGGCAGNVCGFDEPRFQSGRGAVFSACLRDMDAIMGRDDRLIEKTGDALAYVPGARFIAYIGTPVPSVIGTDFRALKRMAEKKFGIPVITCATNGMDSYDKGEIKAYRALIDTFAADKPCRKAPAGGASRFAGIWGATPLELAAPDSAQLLRKRCASDGLDAVTYGMDSTIDDMMHCGDAEVNYAVSPAGLSAVRYLNEKFGTPYRIAPPAGFDGMCSPGGCIADGPVLVIHQQFMADGVRSALRKAYGKDAVSADVATFFEFDSEHAEPGDCALSGEDDLARLAESRGYRTIVADPLIMRALPDFTGTAVPFPHFAVSGQLYAPSDEQSFVRVLSGGLCV